MEYSFYRGKNSIIKKDNFQKFSENIKDLIENSYLSLLLKYVIEYGIEPFGKYFNLLLKQGADINFTQPKTNSNLLMTACKISNLNVVEMFLELEDILAFQKDKARKNILHYAIQNKNEEQSLRIMECIIRRYPQLMFLGNFERGNYISLSIKSQKPSIFHLLIMQEIQSDYLKNQHKIFHKVVQYHHKYQTTLSFLRHLIKAGCREDCLNEKQQNYVNYAINNAFVDQKQINSMLKQLQAQICTKQLTLQTSTQEKLLDSYQEQQFWSDQCFSENENDSQEQDDIDQSYEPNHAEISQQMRKIAVQVYEERNATWTTIHPFYVKLYEIVAQLYGSIQVIGSFASNLWIPSCDIDFLLIIPEQNINLFDDILDLVYSRVKKLGGYTHIKLYLAYKLPMIKLILNKQYGSLEVELFLSNKRNISSQYVAFIHEIISYYPEIQIIYFAIRKILETKMLHDHKKGGLKAYGLFLLIYSMRTQYKYSYVSQFVEHFSYYYGLAYDYVGQMVNGEIVYKININDPLNSDNNMGGKNTDIVSLQQVFKKVYYGLNTKNQGGKMAYILDLIKYT